LFKKNKIILREKGRVSIKEIDKKHQVDDPILHTLIGNQVVDIGNGNDVINGLPIKDPSHIIWKLDLDKEYEVIIQTPSALANMIKENLCMKFKKLEIEALQTAKEYKVINEKEFEPTYCYYKGKARAYSEAWSYILFPNGYSEDDDDYKKANKKLTEKAYEKIKEKRDAKSRK